MLENASYVCGERRNSDSIQGVSWREALTFQIEKMQLVGIGELQSSDKGGVEINCAAEAGDEHDWGTRCAFLFVVERFAIDLREPSSVGGLGMVGQGDARGGLDFGNCGIGGGAARYLVFEGSEAGDGNFDGVAGFEKDWRRFANTDARRLLLVRFCF